MLSRLPSVSGELITRDCRTMHGGRGCARPAPDSPRCQAGTAWQPLSERNGELFDDLPSGGRWSAGNVRRFQPRASFEADRGFDKGNSAEPKKNVMCFFPCRLCFLVKSSPLRRPHAPIAVAQHKCSIVTKERARPTCASWGSKRKRAHGRQDKSEPCRSSM